MYFELKLGRLSAKVELSYRITIVDDDSGVGKTRLYDAIRKYPGNRAKILRSKNGILTLIPKYSDFYKKNSGYPINKIMIVLRDFY